MAPGKQTQVDRGTSSKHGSRQTTGEPPRSSSSNSTSRQTTVEPPRGSSSNNSSRQNSIRDKSSTNSSRQNTGDFSQEDSKQSLPTFARSGRGNSSNRSASQDTGGTPLEEYNKLAGLQQIVVVPPHERLTSQIQKRLSEGASMKDMIERNNPGPGSLRFEDYGITVCKKVSKPRDQRSISKEWKKPPTVESMMYHAGFTYRLDKDKTDMESARKNENALIAGVKAEELRMLRLGTIFESDEDDILIDEAGFETSINYKILHPDALIILEAKTKNLANTFLINQDVKKEHYLCKKAVEVKVGTNTSLDQFYRETICKAICSKHSLAGLDTDENRQKYMVTMLAHNHGMQEVVTRDNWEVFLTEMWFGAAWKLELFLIEIAPAGEKGTWETLTMSSH